MVTDLELHKQAMELGQARITAMDEATKSRKERNNIRR